MLTADFRGAFVMELHKYKDGTEKAKSVCTYEIKLYTNLNGLPVIRNLSDLTKELNVAFESDSVNVDLVNYLMNSYKSNPVEWKKYAKFDRVRYTRNLVDAGNGKYNLMTLCWGAGQGSPVHDHSGSQCFMKIIQGSLEELRFAWPEKEGDKLDIIARKRLQLNEICYMNDSMGLHRVENPSHADTAVSLHLYYPPYNKCLVFNQNTGHRCPAEVTFWSMYGEKRNRVKCEWSLLYVIQNTYFSDVVKSPAWFE